MNIKNISLIGFMGSGKSTIGNMLSKELKMLFIDIDRIIELSENKIIKDIFEAEGEKYFRNLESEVIKKIYSNKNCIFACGGGVVERVENMSIIKSSSTIVYLYISANEAYERLKFTKDRPLLEGKDRKEIIERLIKKRDVLYNKYADLKVNAKDRDSKMVIKNIMEKLGI
ncbi:MAG: shikimate kinase [Actinobacteria bacterium]|nr:shikimate kinase [Actinomycetota bacterium]